MTHTTEGKSSLPLETIYVETNRVNWNGEPVPDGPWIEKNVISIGDLKLKNKDFVYAGSSAMIILVTLLCACLCVSYYKRKSLTTYGRRLSQQLGMSRSENAQIEV